MKTNLERKTIIINCMRTPLNNTLGVVNVLMHLAERLHARCDVFFVVPELNKAKHTPHWI